MLGDPENPFADDLCGADGSGLGGGAFGGFGGELLVDGDPDAKKKKKKKSRRAHREDPSFDGGLDASAAQADLAGLRPPAGAPGEGDGSPSARGADILGGGVAYLGAVMAADCDFSRRIQDEVTKMDDELRVLRQQCSQLHEEVLFATAEHQLASEQKQACESQLQRARYQAELLRRRRTTSLEKAGVTGERSLCLDELQFLEELQALSEQELLEINRLNSSVQAQVSASEAIAQPLEARRREALLEVAAERRRQRRDLLALRRAEAELEQLRGEPSGERARRLRAAVRRAELAVAEDDLRPAARCDERAVPGGEKAELERAHHLRAAFRSAERALAEAEGDSSAWWAAPTNPFAAAAVAGLGGSPQPPPRPTQFDQIFEDRAPEPDHLRRHLAAGRASSGPLDV